MIMNILLLTLVVYIVGNAGGYAVHWLLHQEWSGRAYEDHYHHHFTIYPVEDFLSPVYREPPIEAGQAKYYLTAFALMSSPLLFWHWGYFLLAYVEVIALLKLNSSLHDALHVSGHRWKKYQWYLKLRALHFEHHVDTGTNLGIFSFFADRIVGTYERVHKVVFYVSSDKASRWLGGG